jgi:nicotinamidase-related amidase
VSDGPNQNNELDNIDVLRSCSLLDRQRAQVLVIDLQEKLLPVIQDGSAVLKSAQFLLDACRILQVPAYLSEQYPKGLGPTVEPLAGHEGICSRVEKMRFSAADEFCREVSATAGQARNMPQGRDQVILVGIETHVCVLQTAHDLISRGFNVYVAVDAVGSRHVTDHNLAISRLRDHGVVICSTESVVFELTESAESPEFRAISQLVRSRER